VTNDADVRWSSHLHEEVDFWRSALSRPGERMRERAERRELQDWVKREIDPAIEHVRILDVGSGPLTTLGTEWPGKRLDVVALDPLADDYNRILDEIELTAPAPPVAGRGEALVDSFGREVFDFVLAANALDHCADPVVVIEQMLGVCKPGATVFLHHVVDVADHEHHHGLHQWNLRPVVTDGTQRAIGDMVIDGDGRAVLLSQLAPDHHIEVEVRGDEFLVWVRVPHTLAAG
jgi:SAM-dependent methyltransferase